MKKLAKIYTTAFSFIFLCLTIFGCAENDLRHDPFSLLYGDVTAEISLQLSGSVSTARYQKNGDVTTVTLLSPSTLRGFTFTATGESTVLSGGEVTVDANGQIGLLPRLLSSVLSEKKENITEITTERSDSGVLTVIRTPLSTYRFGADGVPVSAEGVFEEIGFKICFNAFSTAEGKP